MEQPMKTIGRGTLYGVSVGPGDPELMTLQAVRLLERCQVVAAPQTASGQMLALTIAAGAVDLSGKTVVPLAFPMTRNREVLRTAHEQAAALLQAYLDQGQDVAVLSLGDVSVYSTFHYLKDILEAQGYPTAMLAGVPSFCAAAARLNQSLTAGMDEPLTIAPGGRVEEILPRPGSKVLMKTGRQLPKTLQTLADQQKLAHSAMVCNCGLPNEAVWPDLSRYDPEQPAGYFATILVKE